jgi:hypothetical protein
MHGAMRVSEREGGEPPVAPDARAQVVHGGIVRLELNRRREMPMGRVEDPQRSVRPCDTRVAGR